LTKLELNTNADNSHTERITFFADVILPIPLPGTYTYRIPRDIEQFIHPGHRVIVQFGKRKILTGLVKTIHQKPPKTYEAKYILDNLDEFPTVNQFQLDFFDWLASYYMCTIGEVFNAALPSGLKLTSESLIQPNPDATSDDWEYSQREQQVLDALREKDRLSYEEVSDLLGIKLIHPVLKSLIEKEQIILFEKVKDKYKPKMIKKIYLREEWIGEESLKVLFDQLEKRPKQLEVLLKFLSILGMDKQEELKIKSVARLELLNGGISDSSLKTLIKNGVFRESSEKISRLGVLDNSFNPPFSLSSAQAKCRDDILFAFQQNKPVLLHGITGSGKTEIYVDLVQKALENGGQVLYLLPEIALTTQIVSRLHKIFGNQMGIFHSKYSDNERVEVWNAVASGQINFVVGVRSSIFLPYANLSLIIVDEEHEPSYKQYEPAPRYHARDAAIWLARLHQSGIVLGSATPSIESYFNVKEGKYALAELSERFGESVLPKFEIANILTARKAKRMQGDFTPELLSAIKKTLEEKEQVILFQNRRGYSPYIICKDCNHVPRCQNCDVSLTYHMHADHLVCHYCGHKESVPAICDACGSTNIKTVGFGTEKLEEDLKLLFPDAGIQRMDQDTTRSKYSYQNIIDLFENKAIDILVGTQMVSKGLDFEHVALVGVFDYDRLVHFPDFRSHERAFQLVTQVAGRAGRKKKQGKVVVQTGSPEEGVLDKIQRNDFIGMYQSEILEREKFQYPPLFRMIKITLRHKEKSILQEAAKSLGIALTAELGKQKVLGPQPPIISRIRNMHLEEIFIKVQKKGISIGKLKQVLFQLSLDLKKQARYKSVWVSFDVDPI